VTRLLFGLALLAGASAAEAASFMLSDAQKQEAARVGERSVSQETYDGEWRVSGSDGSSLIVLTPFHRLVVAGRHAGFKKEPLKPSEADKLLKEQAGRLVVWVSLRGTSEDFARFYEPQLILGERRIKPSFVQNERTAIRRDDGAYVARCVYGFPVQDLPANSKVALVVADADGRDVSRFTIDLSTMR
jgi:hypothetical protein